MALDLESTSSQYAHLATPAWTDQPFSMACWILPENDIGEEIVAGLFDSGTTNHFHRMQISAGNLLQAGSAAGGTTNVANSIASVAYGVGWHHCFSSFGPTTGNDRQVTLDGGTLQTSTTNRAATGLDRFVLGANYNGGAPAGFFDGLVAMFAVWVVQLTQREASALALGVNPLSIRPSALRHFWPLWNDARDLGRAHSPLTLEASPSFSQRMPRVAWDAGAIWIPMPTAAVAEVVPRYPAINHQNPAIV